MEFRSGALSSSTSSLTSSMRCDDLSSLLSRSDEEGHAEMGEEKEIITTQDTNLIKDLGKIHLSRSLTDLTESNSILPSSPLKNEISYFKPSTNSPKRRRSPDHLDLHKSTATETAASTTTSPYTTPPHSNCSLHSSSTKTSPESPSLLSRRAALGTLPNKSLVILQQMRFAENHLHSTSSGSFCEGLGVGPGSPGFEGLEGLSPLIPTGAAGQAFRAALGLDSPKDGSKTPPTIFNPKKENEKSLIPTSDSNGDLSSSILASPDNFFIRSPSANNRRRLLGLNSTSSPHSTTTTATNSDNLVKIPPSLRGSRILDTLNLSPQTPHLSSPRLIAPPRTSSSSQDSPTNSPISRSSAFNNYFSTAPLTPLTPSHMPGAPSLPYSNSGGFEWSSYSMPDSPSCPLPPGPKSIFESNEIIPREGQAFFLPGSGSGNVGLFGLSTRGSYLPGSPLKERPSGSRGVGNPFF